MTVVRQRICSLHTHEWLSCRMESKSHQEHMTTPYASQISRMWDMSVLFIVKVGESSGHQVKVGMLATHTGCCVYKVGFDGCEVKLARLCLTPDVAALSTLPL